MTRDPQLTGHAAGACHAARKKSTVPYHAGINEGKTWVKCCDPGKRSDPCDPEQCIGPDDVETKKLSTGRPNEDCTAERRRWVELGGRRSDDSCPSTALLASESDFDGCRVPTIEELAYEPIDKAKRFGERFVRTPRHETFEAYKEEAQRDPQESLKGAPESPQRPCMSPRWPQDRPKC